jgi:hypothetical protein
MRFYGMGFLEVEELPVTLFNELYQAMNVIQAEENLNSCTVSSYSDLKKEARSRYDKRQRQELKTIEGSGSAEKPNLEKLVKMAKMMKEENRG